MFGWLRRLWSRDQERLIFTYRDGTSNRRVDPLAVLRQLESELPDWAAILDQTRAPEMPVAGTVGAELVQQRKDAVAKLIDAARRLFGVKPLDDTGGLTEAETLGLFTAYLSFMGGLAEEALPLSQSPPVGDSSPAASDTALSVACTSTGT